MSEHAPETENLSPDEADEHEDEGQAEERSGARSWAVRGAIIGGVAGATAGAGVGAVFARQPETRRSVKELVTRSSRQLATAAAVAVGEVLATKSLKQLITSNGNGDRRELMKETAKEAAAAAAQATRDTIVTLRRGPEADADESS